MSLLDSIKQYYWLGGRPPVEILDLIPCVLIEDSIVDTISDGVVHEAVYLQKHMAATPAVPEWVFVDEWVGVRYIEPHKDTDDEWKKHPVEVYRVEPTVIDNFERVYNGDS